MLWRRRMLLDDDLLSGWAPGGNIITPSTPHGVYVILRRAMRIV